MIKHGVLGQCLVIGGGFMGASLAQRLTDSGVDVTVFSHTFSRSLDRIGPSSPTLVTGDVCKDEAVLCGLINSADIVLFCVGTSTPATAFADPATSIEGTLVPAAKVMQAMRDHGEGRLAVLSSGGTIYGAAEKFPTPEDHPPGPKCQHGMNSTFLEQMAELHRREYGVEYQVFRLANVFGPGERAIGGQGVIAHWLCALDRGDPLRIIGSLDTERDMVYIDDAVEAILHGLREGSWSAVYNVGSGHSVSLATIRDELCHVAGVDPPVEQVAAREVDIPKTHLDISRLVNDTGWHPRFSLRDGIERCWAALTDERPSARDRAGDPAAERPADRLTA